MYRNGVGRPDADVAEVQGDLPGSNSAEGPDFCCRGRFLGAWLM